MYRRPISLLPMQGKLLEQIIHNRVTLFCEDNNMSNDQRGGFRRNHSTVSTVALFMNNPFNAINATNYSIATLDSQGQSAANPHADCVWVNTYTTTRNLLKLC